MPYKNKQEQKKYLRRYYRENGERLKTASYLYYLEHKEEVLSRTQNFQQTDAFKAWKKQYDKKRYQEIREKVLTYYGNGKLACVKCSFDDTRALSIDHIEGGGVQHKKLIGQTIYYWLRARSYPKGYQTLCMNCQFIKREENHEVYYKL